MNFFRFHRGRTGNLINFQPPLCISVSASVIVTMVPGPMSKLNVLIWNLRKNAWVGAWSVTSRLVQSIHDLVSLEDEREKGKA